MILNTFIYDDEEHTGIPKASIHVRVDETVVDDGGTKYCIAYNGCDVLKASGVVEENAMKASNGILTGRTYVSSENLSSFLLCAYAANVLTATPNELVSFANYIQEHVGRNAVESYKLYKTKGTLENVKQMQ